VQAFTKRPLLLVLAAVVVLDIVGVQTVLSRHKDSAPPGAASASRTPPGVVPVTVAPPSIGAGEAPSPQATAPTEPTPIPTPTPEPTEAPEPPATASPTPIDLPTPIDTPTPRATPTPTPETQEPPDSTPTEPVIRITESSFAGRLFETVRIDGTYAGSHSGTILRVQRIQDGEWTDFPLPTTTDASGRFTAHVEFGTIGSHKVRVVDPLTDRSSPTVVVVIR
jgi:hypothetical protein